MKSAVALIRKLKKIGGNDKHFYELVRKGAVAFFARVAGAGLTFLLYIYLARHLGVHDYGLFMLAFTIVNVFSVLARMGMDNVLIRHIASAVEVGNYAEAKGYLILGIAISLVAGLLFTLIVYCFGDWLTVNVLKKPELSPTLLNMIWLLMPFSLAYLLGEALKGLRHVGEAAITQVSILPGLSLALLFLFSHWKHLTVDNVTTIYVFSGVAAYLLGLYYWNRAIPKVRAVYPAVREMLRSGIPLLLATSGMLVMSWSDTLILGIYETSEIVGMYNAAARTAMITSLILVAVNAIAAPKYAALYANNNIDALRTLAQKATMLMTLLIIPPSLLMLLFPKWFLGLFGDEFIPAASVFMILVIGQFINVACGSVGYLLAMTGHEVVMRNILLITSIFNVVLSLALVKYFGVIGVALATAISVACWNISMVFSVKRKLGFWTTGINLSLPCPVKK